MEDGLLKGDMLLNLDNETHGELMVGSAGGINLTAELEFQTVAPEAGDKAVRIVLHGLRGGHSGLEINEGRANANKNLARVVADAIANFEARLAEWKGGNMRNAIPREAEAVLTLPAENEAALKEAVETEWGDRAQPQDRSQGRSDAHFARSRGNSRQPRRCDPGLPQRRAALHSPPPEHRRNVEQPGHR